VSLVGLDQYEKPDLEDAPVWPAGPLGGPPGNLLATPEPAHSPEPPRSYESARSLERRRMPSYPGPDDGSANHLLTLDGMPDHASGTGPGISGGGEAAAPAIPEGTAPDNSGDLSLISPMRAIADLAVAADTGLLRFCKQGQYKDVYLVRGAPESVNSNMTGDRFGEYLVTRGFLRSADLERALIESPHFGGKFGEALVGLGFMRPLDVFRLLSQHVRERVMELFTWTEGSYDYYRGLRNPMEAFPLGLSSFEILGAGVVALSYDFLVDHFETLMDFHPRAMPNPRVNPEAFRLGPTPREVLGLLDGSLTLRDWASRFASPDELLTFYRTLYLLVETSMAQFE
jgi:hypothetical protein